MAERKEQLSKLFFRFFWILCLSLGAELVLVLYLIRPQQELSLLPIIQNGRIRYLIYRYSYILYGVTAIVIVLRYLVQRRKLRNRN